MEERLELLILREPVLKCGITSKEKGKCGPWCNHYDYDQMPMEGGKCKLDEKGVKYKQTCHYNKTKQEPVYQLKK